MKKIKPKEKFIVVKRSFFDCIQELDKMKSNRNDLVEKLNKSKLASDKIKIKSKILLLTYEISKKQEILKTSEIY